MPKPLTKLTWDNAALISPATAKNLGVQNYEVAADEIEITLEDNVLTIAGKSERRQFTRSLLLPDEIDGENVGAHVEHGLLTLTLPSLAAAGIMLWLRRGAGKAAA